MDQPSQTDDLPDAPWITQSNQDDLPDAPWVTNDALNAAKATLATGLNAGQRDDPVAAAAWRTNQGVPRAGATDAAISGATLGWGDEASAALRAPIDAALRGEALDEAYGHNLAAERERLETYRRENPAASTAAEMAGGMAISPVKGAEFAIGMPKLIGQGAAVGALTGGGNSTGDLIDRAKDAVVGGVIGAGATAVIPAVVGAAKALASPFTRNIAAAVNPEKNAVNAFTRDLQRDKVTIPEARAALAEAQAEGKPMTIGDLGGRNVMGLNRTVATGKSEGAQRVQTLHEARKLDAPARIAEDLRKSMSDPDAFMATAEQLIANRKAISSPLYEMAYAKPFNNSSIVNNFLSKPAGKAAAKAAEELAANEGVPFNTVSVRGVDLLKRSLDDMIDKARRSGGNNEARVLQNMKNNLVGAVDRVVPEYKAARQAFSSQMELQDALDKGASYLKASGLKPEQAVAEIRDMDGGVRAMARLGAAREIKAMFDNPSYSLSKINQLLNSGRMKTVLPELFESPEAFNRFRANLVRERVMLDRSQKITGGSNTANKLAEGEDIGDMAGIVRDAATGHPIRAAVNAVGAFGNRAIKGINEKTANSLGEILSSADPARQKQILDLIEKQIGPAEWAKLLGVIGGREAPLLIRKSGA